MKGLEPSQINLLEPKPSASTNSATSTVTPLFEHHSASRDRLEGCYWWSKCNIPHKDITVTYPLSLLYMEINSNRQGRTRTYSRQLRRLMHYPLCYLPKGPPCLCIIERHGRGGNYLRFGPSTPMRQSYQFKIWLSSECRVVVNLNQSSLISAPLHLILSLEPRHILFYRFLGTIVNPWST